MKYHKRRIVLRLLRLSEHALRMLFFLLLLFAFDTPSVACLTLLCALLHEGGHLLAIFLLGGGGGHFSSRLNGLVYTPSAPLSYRAELLVAVAGPASNFFFALLSLLLLPLGARFFLTFALCHLMTALSNLLPLQGYDGERVLTAWLALSGKEGRGTLRGFSFFLTSLLLFFALYLVGRCGEGYWLLGVFFFSLLLRLQEGLQKHFSRF